MNRKNTAASGKLIKAVYGSYVCVYMLCASQWGRLEYDTVVVGKMVRGEGAWVICVCISYSICLIKLKEWNGLQRFPVKRNTIRWEY